MKFKLQLLLIAAALSCTASVYAEDKTKTSSGDGRYEQLALFNKVLHFIEEHYVEDVKEKDLFEGALKGMLETLDPHSNLLTAESYKDMKIDTAGKFGGIGLEMGVKDSVLTVVTPIDDTPAYKAGIKAGDRIIKINGDGTKGLSLSEAVTKMRGKKGSDVKLTIWREGFTKPREFVVRRADIKIQSVKSEELEPHYLYLRLASFNEHAARDLKKIMDKHESKHGLMKGLILDLRNNPGGLLDQAVEVSSLFVEEGVVVSTRGRSKEMQEVKKAVPGMARKYMPVAVLVNGATASAAEIVAGALQDHKRAVIMGQTSFGKGSVQTVVEVTPEMGLKLTVARYFTPNGRSIQQEGIQPDVFLDDLDQKVIEEATRKQEFTHERDLKRSLGRGGEKNNEESNEFKMEELITLGKENTEEKDKKAKTEDEVRPVSAKEDYQVKQALNYMKSFQVLKAMKLGPVSDDENFAKKAEVSKD